VAFAIRDSYEIAKALGIKVERTKMCGGGARSPLWRKILANVLDLKVDILEAEEGPALGGAMLAAVGCGEYASVEEAAERLVRTRLTVEPDPEIVALYDERYKVYMDIYPQLKGIFQKL
jgi:xylulokinase